MKTKPMFILLLSFLMAVTFKTPCQVKREIKDGVEHIYNPEHGLWQNRKTPPIKFELIRTFGKENEPEEELFGGIIDAFTDNDLNVYMFDYKMNKLIKYDKNGKFLWAKGRKGNGPGDFNNVFNLKFDGKDKIYVGQNWGSRIDVFSTDGKFIKSLKSLEPFSTGLTVEKIIGQNQLVVSKNHYVDNEVSYLFYSLDEKLELQNTIKLSAKGNYEILIGFNIPLINYVTDDYIVLFAREMYKFSFFSFKGKHLKTVHRDFNKMVKPAVYKGNFVTMQIYSQFTKMINLSTEYFMVNSFFPEKRIDSNEYLKEMMENKATDVKRIGMLDLYNKKGELLYSIYSPEIGGIMHVDKNGNLYTTHGAPFPQVRCYKVIINEK